MNKSYGVEFATSNLNITFPELDDKEICMIEIKAGLKPVYTSVTDNNANTNKKFYVRSGNSSQELAITEISDYISKRFKS